MYSTLLQALDDITRKSSPITSVPDIALYPSEDLYQRGVENLLSSHLAQARFYFQAAADKGNLYAYIHLHRLSILGINQLPNQQEIKRWAERIHQSAPLLQQQLFNPSLTADQQCCIAWCYWYGMGVTQDRQETMRRYQLVVNAEKPTAIAQIGLGYCIMNQQDLDSQAVNEALKLYEAAHKQGDVLAPYYLGMFYSKGACGISANLKLAAIYYGFSATLGNIEAQYLLGDIYMCGKEVPIDVKKALFWYQKAAIAGHPQAQYALGLYYKENRSAEDKQCTQPRDIFKAIQWLEYAAAQREWRAFPVLARCYEEIGMKAKAQATHRQLADQIVIMQRAENNSQTNFALARCYMQANEVEKALLFYERSANAGYITAQFELIAHYLEKNQPKEALVRAQKTAEQHHTDPVVNAKANYWLGRCYSELNQPDNALPRYLTAANADDSDAQLALVRCYADRHDFTNAFAWCAKAQQQSHPLAVAMMQTLQFMKSMYDQMA